LEQGTQKSSWGSIQKSNENVLQDLALQGGFYYEDIFPARAFSVFDGVVLAYGR
jgi:hypothetical protein